jgi:RHH-type proline utilization regulon transcriptional repressor/proline dehydrogenase/delta 1-pyrroline-5-carboxylate dehydrogenase
MLEGMADHVRRAICEMSGDMLLYAPVATKDHFINAIAYLIRRLDENTSEENFLRYACDLKTDSREWTFLKDQFLESLDHRHHTKTKPNRTQDRQREVFPGRMGTFYEGEFNNEPDTDWSLAANRRWGEGIRARWKKGPGAGPAEIPMVIAGEEIYSSREVRDCFDPSQTNVNICVARHSLATHKDAERAVATAAEDPDGWRKKTQRQRHRILSKVAMELRRSRSELIGTATANTGKIFSEVDAEISEAVDFTEYYPHSVRAFADFQDITCRGKGVGLVISPWNFPMAIPCSGIAASLAAGNTVIFKPSSYSVMAAWQLCQCFWNAGISKSTLQFIPCKGSTTGAKLARHPDVDFIILTGGTDTGMDILKDRPEAFLVAETGGKNATIVTSMADRDQAIKNVIHSAFGNGGQKCSATSLLILEKEIYEDEKFKTQLVDAARSFSVGSAWEFHNRTGALIIPPLGVLKRAQTQLEPGETWALKSENIHDNPHMWTPCIKWDVQPGSFTHVTEFFGPVLGVMCADNLDHAIDLVNQTGFGLTSGLESLDDREQAHWISHIRAGNLYINRETTGAVVLRQPFGGMGKSALGAGIKVGGPNYVTQFMDFKETGIPSFGAINKEYPLLHLAQLWKQKLDWGQFKEFEGDLKKTILAIKSYLYHAEQEFFQEKDYFHIRGQDNIVRYLPVGSVVVRLHEHDSLFEVLARIAAVRIAGCNLTVSIPPELDNSMVSFLEGRNGTAILGGASVLRQTDMELMEMIPKIQRIRYAAPERIPSTISEAAAAIGFYISRSKVLMNGRLELLQYFQEQSISNNYHRYGNLGERGLRL